MARHRTIDENAILDAAERAIVEHGAANFTLDAVAAMAGISKGSVVRDYGSKQDLIRAIVRRHFDEYEAMLDAAEQATASRIAAHVDVAGVSLTEEQRIAATNLCSSLSNDHELTGVITAHYQREIATIAAPGADRAALLAFLALEGLKSLELFGSYKWPDADRGALLADISRLSKSTMADID